MKKKVKRIAEKFGKEKNERVFSRLSLKLKARTSTRPNWLTIRSVRVFNRFSSSQLVF